MKTKKGFTFIEVVLVLAIAGLIFSMTFIALPALWASQRDTDRREDVLGFISTLKSYQSNNSRGALPEGNNSDEKEKIKDGRGIEIRLDENGKIAQTGEIGDTSWAGFYRDYFNKDTFLDPNGRYYTWKVMACKEPKKANADGYSVCENASLNELKSSSFGDETSDYTMYIVTSATCYGEEAVYSNNARRVAALYRLEGGGVYCENT